jgi:restriction endonuclease S subunit
MYVDTCEFTKTCLIVNRGGMMNVRVDKNFSVSHDDIHVLSWIDGKTNETTVLYVGYYLQANIDLLADGMNGTTLKHLNKSFLEGFGIPLPSLSKQQEIVDAIDVYTQLAHAEEQSLKLLEKCVMWSVKEMGKGKEMVKLGEVCYVKTGKYITKATSSPGIYPTYGGGDAGACISEYNRENEFMISKDGVSEKCVRYVNGKFFLNHHGWTIEPKGVATYPYVGYWLLSNQDKLYKLAVGTAQKGINQDSFYSIQIPLPSLDEQQTLQSDFDEIKHKHVKIAEYRSKAQEAIQRLIPCANRQETVTKTSQESIESHSSTCAVQADGTGCTCRNSLTENTTSLPSVYKTSKKNKIRITDDEI